jgi:hypothetical protein
MNNELIEKFIEIADKVIFANMFVLHEISEECKNRNFEFVIETEFNLEQLFSEYIELRTKLKAGLKTDFKKVN